MNNLTEEVINSIDVYMESSLSNEIEASMAVINEYIEGVKLMGDVASAGIILESDIFDGILPERNDDENEYIFVFTWIPRLILNIINKLIFLFNKLIRIIVGTDKEYTDAMKKELDDQRIDAVNSLLRRNGITRIIATGVSHNETEDKNSDNTAITYSFKSRISNIKEIFDDLNEVLEYFDKYHTYLRNMNFAEASTNAANLIGDIENIRESNVLPTPGILYPYNDLQYWEVYVKRIQEQMEECHTKVKQTMQEAEDIMLGKIRYTGADDNGIKITAAELGKTVTKLAEAFNKVCIDVYNELTILMNERNAFLALIYNASINAKQ